jgi:tRNA threonylcarbamoyladenosine biosynthesis protein TsaB
MRTLAIDTSLATGSVAAADDGGAVSLSLGPAGDHARRLMPLVQEAATARGWRPREVELVAVVRGPGSFTGLRVGLATAKAIAWACGARLVAVCGFEVIARRTAALVGTIEPVAIAFDAGRGEVFAALARSRDSTGERWLIDTPALRPLDDWLDGLPAGSLISGPALQQSPDRTIRSPPLRLAPPAAWVGDALDVARLARIAAAAGARDDPATLVPLYLRPSYADERGGQAG